uniref:Uncharacterized protein n=1 Tax=Trichuris muris TaxID=70415 RepID=A0A5S6Q5V7_TRIMR
MASNSKYDDVTTASDTFYDQSIDTFDQALNGTGSVDFHYGQHSAERATIELFGEANGYSILSDATHHARPNDIQVDHRQQSYPTCWKQIPTAAEGAHEKEIEYIQKRFHCDVDASASAPPSYGKIHSEYGTTVWHVAASRKHIYNFKKPVLPANAFGEEPSTIELQCAQATCTVHWHAKTR